MVFSALGYIWAFAKEVMVFFMYSCGAIAGGGRSRTSHSNCRVVVLLGKRLDQNVILYVFLKIYYNAESPQDLRIKAISFSRSSEEY